MNKAHRRGFTLIELLVVVSIIALLVSILLPALAEARRQGKLALDQANLHQIGIGLTMYAGENNDDYPRNAYGNWLFDISYSTTDYLIATGGAKEIFYCPLEGVKNCDEDIFWRACECWGVDKRDLGNKSEPTGSDRDTYFRVTGYFWLFGPEEGYEKYRPKRSFIGDPERTWVYKSTQRGAADTEFVVDMTVSTSLNLDNARFEGIRAGLWHWGVEDKTAHLSKDLKARDGHCLYVDGHVYRKQFEEMVYRYTIFFSGAYPYHWW